MEMMFHKASAFNQPIGAWDTSKVTTMELMFHKASAFQQNLSAWSLNVDIGLENLFTFSGMSEAQFCQLKAKGGEWLGVAEVSGAVCE